MYVWLYVLEDESANKRKVLVIVLLHQGVGTHFDICQNRIESFCQDLVIFAKVMF